MTTSETTKFTAFDNWKLEGTEADYTIWPYQHTAHQWGAEVKNQNGEVVADTEPNYRTSAAAQSHARGRIRKATR